MSHPPKWDGVERRHTEVQNLLTRVHAVQQWRRFDDPKPQPGPKMNLREMCNEVVAGQRDGFDAAESLVRTTWEMTLLDDAAEDLHSIAGICGKPSEHDIAVEVLRRLDTTRHEEWQDMPKHSTRRARAFAAWLAEIAS